jgi:hypothetical protein
MEIKIEQDKVQEIISQAILRELGSEQRDLLIAQAIQYLLKEQQAGSGYSSRKFIPLHDAFNNAVANSARQIAHDYIHNNAEVQQKLKELLTEAMDRVFVAKRETIVEAIATAVIRGFERER